MGSCNLGPSFPAWLRSQKEIVILDFSNASISGSIPNWFWDMSGTLSYLNVSLNHLKGHLPNPLNISPSVTSVDLSSNLFQVSIPLPLALPNVSIQVLDLSNNQFSGSIPNKIGKILPHLQFLSLSNNQLTGHVPASIGEISTLQILDLSGNSLIGSIPLNIGNCSNLTVLDLQNNNLSVANVYEEIPECKGKTDHKNEATGVDWASIVQLEIAKYMQNQNPVTNEASCVNFTGFAARRSWGGVYFALVDRIVDRLSNASALVDRIIHGLSSASSRIATQELSTVAELSFLFRFL
ncbi:hypothetical protein GH714_002386 [Hevea brasiliensis]|uniref:Uncharacterized protein n=1 Tax=Hevea brasiliensis TaxID=3981 RepID=A0A6A6KY69_HEVBR|nr:hypothetical protein GH714_002386 [Hevea brasiliensis]